MNLRCSQCPPRSAAVLAGMMVIGVAVAAVAPTPLPLPLTEPPIDPRVANKVTSFASDHPEFAVLRDGRKDATGITFPHQKHLAGTDSMRGDMKKWKGTDRSMECLDCHRPDPDGRSMLPVTFEQHCVACHSLGEIEVAQGVVEPTPTPHGDETAIAAVVDAQTLRWIATNAVSPPAPAEEARPARGGRRGGGDAPKRAELPKDLNTPDKLAAFLVDQRDKVFKSLARGTDCGYCHTVEKAEEKGSPFVVKNPVIPDQWMVRSVFSHAAHAMLSCQSCHPAETSASSSDVLMPGIDSCRACHSPAGGAEGARISSAQGAGDSCVMCHVYHPKNSPPVQGKLKPSDLLRE